MDYSAKEAFSSYSLVRGPYWKNRNRIIEGGILTFTLRERSEGGKGREIFVYTILYPKRFIFYTNSGIFRTTLSVYSFQKVLHLT